MSEPFRPEREIPAGLSDWQQFVTDEQLLVIQGCQERVEKRGRGYRLLTETDFRRIIARLAAILNGEVYLRG